MKKIIIVISILMLMIMINKEDYYVIPKEAIRLRIIANSNNIEDQYIKNKVKENINKEIQSILQTSKIEESRTKIEENIEKIKTIIKNTLKEENIKYDYKINYGKNYFPEKIYKNVKYEAGEYESLVITLGSGDGNNWWCVLFPPICVIEENETKEIEYKSYIKEIITKYIVNE